MNIVIREQRVNVERLRQQLALAESQLSESVRNCRHEWSAGLPDHIYHEGYTIPGDPPGVGGVDHQFPRYVEPRTEKRWKRVCMKCGEIQHTSKIKTEIIEHPHFDS